MYHAIFAGVSSVVSATALPFDVASFLGPGVEYIAPEIGQFTRPEFLEAIAKHAPAGLIVPLTERVDRELLTTSPGLKVVGNFAVGYDNVDLETASELKVLVANTPDVLTETTADFTFALLLGIARRICEGHRVVLEDKWTGFSPTLLLGANVAGQTLGIIGLGRIGHAVARRGRGFGMRILYSGRFQSKAAALGYNHVDEDELFRESDFVSLHCPLTDATKNLVNRDTLDLMKTSAFLINVARGGCVDEVALADELANERIAGAALDVFAREPEVYPALKTNPRVLLAPHIGSATRQTRAKMAELCASAVKVVLEGGVPSNSLNPEVLQ